MAVPLYRARDPPYPPTPRSDPKSPQSLAETRVFENGRETGSWPTGIATCALAKGRTVHTETTMRGITSLLARRARRRSTRILVDLVLFVAFTVTFLTHERSFDRPRLPAALVGRSGARPVPESPPRRQRRVDRKGLAKQARRPPSAPRCAQRHVRSGHSDLHDFRPPALAGLVDRTSALHNPRDHRLRRNRHHVRPPRHEPSAHRQPRSRRRLMTPPRRDHGGADVHRTEVRTGPASRTLASMTTRPCSGASMGSAWRSRRVTAIRS